MESEDISKCFGIYENRRLKNEKKGVRVGEGKGREWNGIHTCNMLVPVCFARKLHEASQPTFLLRITFTMN